MLQIYLLGKKAKSCYQLVLQMHCECLFSLLVVTAAITNFAFVSVEVLFK